MTASSLRGPQLDTRAGPPWSSNIDYHGKALGVLWLLLLVVGVPLVGVLGRIRARQRSRLAVARITSALA